MSFTISDLIVETVQKAGVRQVYGHPGDALDLIELARTNVSRRRLS